MCIMDVAGGAARVHGTQIFVGPTIEGRQLTVYANYVSLAGDAAGGAMILPVPRGRIRLLDLSGKRYESLFENLQRAFPKLTFPGEGAQSRGLTLSARSVLEVREVGNYLVSVAPRLEDLARIDPSSFKVSPGIASLLSAHYARDFAFVVCRFKSKEVEPHPIAFEHERRQDGRLFVPTRHAHGGHDGEDADWDHDIYATCASEAAFASGAAPEGGAGVTPEELQERLEGEADAQKELGAKVRPAFYQAWQAVQATGLDSFAGLLPCAGVLRHKRVDTAFGRRFPNEDLLYALAPSLGAQLPALATAPELDHAVAEEVGLWLKVPAEGKQADSAADIRPGKQQERCCLVS